MAKTSKRGAGQQMAMGTIMSGYHLRLSDLSWRAIGPKGEKSGRGANEGDARAAARKALADVRGETDK